MSDSATEREECARVAEAYAEYQDALREREILAGRGGEVFASVCGTRVAEAYAEYQSALRAVEDRARGSKKMSTIESAEDLAGRFFDDRVWSSDRDAEGHRYTLRADEVLRARDKAVVELCADKLAERGLHLAANSLRKMLREGKLLPP
jgi:hypothetical protein